MYDLTGKVVLITGGSRGIGRALADKFAQLGAKVVITYKSRIDFRHFKPRGIHYFKCDSADAKRVKQVVENVISKFGGVDVLVNNAGITKDGLLMRMSESDWDSVIDTNLKGTFLFCKYAAKSMVKKQSGKIINVSSVVGTTGNAGQANYSASKAGQIGITKALAKELGPYNIQVNTLAPGLVETDMISVLSAEVREKMYKMTGTKPASPDKVADFAAFLASPDSDLINGQTFIVEASQLRKEDRKYFKNKP
ncbi:MAG TPA: 3-oxoacyl-ACP reductase family protein [Ignavibacteria bacterium]|nr:3-oxoacyl-ACP reductase family protein [Ignavibacteria bacterium]